MINPWHPGHFDLPDELVSDCPDEIVQLFAHFKVLPVRAEMLYCENVIRYAALSPYFDAVPDGVMGGSYLFTIDTSDDAPNRYGIRKLSEDAS